VPRPDVSYEQHGSLGGGRPGAVAGERAAGWGRRGRRLAVVAGIVTAAIAAAVLVLEAGTLSGASAGAGGSARAGAAVSLAGNPVGLAVDDRTGTVYVASGRAGLFMFSAAGCGSTAVAGCDAHRVAAGGQFAAGVAVDAPADTVYVANGPEQTVSVFGAAGCDAAVARGCAHPVAVIRLPGAPRALAIDPRAGIVYATLVPAQGRRVPTAAPAGEVVAVISARACNASGTRGCGAVMTAPLGPGGPAAIAVDQATGTVYVTQGSSLKIINGSACVTGNAPGCRKIVPAYGYIAGVTAGAPGRVYVTSPDTGTVTGISTRGCAAAAAPGCGSAVWIRAGAGPEATAIGGLAGRTLYVADFTAGTVSMVNLDGCAAVAGGGACSSPDPAFPVGDGPAALAADPVTRTLYVANFGSGTVSVISTAGCDAVSQRGCPARPPAGTRPVRQPPAACDPEVAAYQSGLPAGPFLPSSVRVVGGSIGGQAWSLRALRGVAAPDGIEEGGLVIGGRWYALCSGPLDGGADAASIELIDTAGRGIVYGYIQHPVPVTPALAGPGVPPHPTVIALPGTTFFIAALSRSACATPALTLHGRAPDWSGTANLTFGGCAPGLLVYIPDIEAAWGPGADN
jgi:DNA-binding beta-propeller fold protein YncE